MKKEYLIIIFLLLGPILDVMNFLGYPISVLIRGLFIFSITLYLIIKKKDLKVLIPILLFGIIYFLYQVFYLNMNIVSSISSILKFIYLPITLLFFKEYQLVKKLNKFLTIILFTYISIYLLSYIFNLGVDIYTSEVGKSGFKGLFSSINEFSAILVGLLPIAINYFEEKKKYILLITVIVLTLLCSLLIGTKILLGGVIFCIIYLLWKNKNIVFFDRTLKQKIIILVSIFILLIGGVFAFTKTRTYQNMVVQQNFFKVDNILSIDYLDTVVYNKRLTFLKENYNYYKNQSFPEILLGIGIDNENVKMVEIDIFDIMFRYGIVGLIMFIISLIYSIRFKKLKQDKKLSLILFSLISLTSGHVLIYPAVCIYIGLLVNKEYKVC